MVGSGVQWLGVWSEAAILKGLSDEVKFISLLNEWSLFCRQQNFTVLCTRFLSAVNASRFRIIISAWYVLRQPSLCWSFIMVWHGSSSVWWNNLHCPVWRTWSHAIRNALKGPSVPWRAISTVVRPMVYNPLWGSYVFTHILQISGRF